MKHRSIDDLRNMWRLKLYPVLEEKAGISAKADPAVTNNKWSEAEDLSLLEHIIGQEVTDSNEEIDFSELINNHSISENEIRWKLLLKGVGSMTGRRY